MGIQGSGVLSVADRTATFFSSLLVSYCTFFCSYPLSISLTVQVFARELFIAFIYLLQYPRGRKGITEGSGQLNTVKRHTYELNAVTGFQKLLLMVVLNKSNDGIDIIDAGRWFHSDDVLGWKESL